ncbi:type I polyketide synthase [Nonomuraea soli]|uniref:Acyl transferase domain-containing protein/acyl carrier protein n=1 Tax=Nonomuraea soli TaxID=1032476 RepID=A0A7W0CSQ7_9ACTN|nr:SDR family NAD(P)-dependent oxidoreductase [Nonomuraea soli]MBA2896480.1 acyl transferase domain-containing protein/acyl carrier protein [Nonomuraea soli]
MEPIAIIGMSARVPGAGDLAQFWRNLVDGVESVTVFSREEQLALGVSEAELDDPAFVPAVHVLADMEGFDAPLFGMSAREAELADPQQRLFLEQSHAALTDAGYDPQRYDGEIGVYGGAGPSTYQWLNLRTNPKVAGAGLLGLSVGNNPDYIATTVSYRLDLRGPSLSVTTACSTSLVAVHLACEALRNAECDMALAGGVCVELPYSRGYVALDGYTSASGHVRPFDAGADGTMWGNGVGVVTLKRLSDALEDGDHIRAVILGNAINNDGASKVGFSAPSLQGQAEVIAQALGMADVDPRTIGYVEAHGTGTAMGDPIEVAALSAVYGRDSSETGWCGLGSVKSNLGHLSQASGVVGLIKAVLAMEHGLIPPTVNYERPNPAIDFDSSPFYVASSLTKWDDTGAPRRAAVSSFGIGGTNAHLVLQEAPSRPAVPEETRPQLIQLSARTPAALEAARARLADFVAREPRLRLADVAHTLRAGRPAHRHRAAILADDPAALGDAKRWQSGTSTGPSVAFLFSGQGAQYAGMGAGLYAAEPVFAAAVDRCAELLLPELGVDVRGELTAEDLGRTGLTQPALFTIEYALACLWQEWGVRPAAMIGHSIGEYVAATVAGVFTLPDALRLVTARGRLMQSMPPGSMLAVQRDPEELEALLPDDVRVATVNGPGACVVAGPAESVDELAVRLRAAGLRCTPLRTSHAFHSAMMDPILGEFTAVVASVPRRAPEIPFLSNVTGDWITAEQATDPAYWARHLRSPVLFGACVRTLVSEGAWALLECGPGKQLSSLARMQLREAVAAGAFAPAASLPGPGEKSDDLTVLYGTAARLWVAGVPVSPPSTGRRVSLPGYPYERTRHFVEAGAGAVSAAPAAPRTKDDWFEVPVWRQLPPIGPGEPLSGCVLFADGERASRLAGSSVVVVRPGDAFAAVDGGFTLRPGAAEDYEALVAALGEGTHDQDTPAPGGPHEHGTPALGGITRIVHAWALDGEPAGDDPGAVERAQERGFLSLLLLLQALGGAAEGLRLDVLTEGTQDPLGGDLTRPEHATVAGIVRVAPLELDGLTVTHVDADRATPRSAVLAELHRPADGETVALRGRRRWQRRFEPLTVPDGAAAVREGGRYLVTGGLGGIGITLAEELGTRHRARLVLLSRSGLPPREEWDHPGDSRTARAIAAVRRIEQAGGQVTVVTADVTDPAPDRVLAAYGGLDGIIHAAGLPGDGMIEVRDPDQSRRVLAPKVTGTVALARAFAGQDLDFIALCSSVTALTGGVGQVDYTAANAFQDAYARAATGTRVVSLNWGAWLEVGMAAEAAGTAPAEPVAHPMIRTRSGQLAKGLLSAATHWVLDEHRIGGTPLLPGTAQLECARAAFEVCVPAPGDGHAIELSDVVFAEPLAVPDRTEVSVAIAPGGRFEVAAGGRARTAGAAAWVPSGPASVDPSVLTGRMRPAEPQTGQSAITFGPHWREPEQVWHGDGEELALVEAVFPEEASQWVLHPALLDVATSFGSARGGTYLPLGYGRLLVHAPLPARFYSHLRRRSTGAEVVAADLTLFDESGAVLVEIEEFTLRRVDPAQLDLAGARSPEPAGTGIRPADGAAAFLRVLAADPGPQVVVSATALAEIAERERTPAAAPEPAGPVAERSAPYNAPSTELGATIARIWGEVLGVARVGADDDFFDLGGNSLVAVQLIAQVRAATGVKLPMRTLFEAPTVEQMAARVEQLSAKPQAPTAIPRLARR